MRLLLVLSGAVVMVMQGCSVTRLKRENLKLQGLQQDAARIRKDLEQARKSSLRHEFDAQSLRTEAGRLRQELKVARQELTQARQDQAAVSSSRGAAHAPAYPGTGSQPVRNQSLIHLMPEALARLQPHSIDPSTLTSVNCCIDGVWLENIINRDDVSAGPDWEPSQPVPLSSQEAEWKARQEIRRLFRDGDRWVMNGASLHDDHGSRKWYYSISFQSPDKKAHFSVYVSMSGAVGTTTLGRNIEEEISQAVPAPGQ
jgi:hypothetical protein